MEEHYDGSKVRSGVVPRHVAKLASPCPCGGRVPWGYRRGVWVRFTRSWPNWESCSCCQRARAWSLKRMREQFTEKVGGFGDLTAAEEAQFARLVKRDTDDLREHPRDRVGAFIGCPYHYALYADEPRKLTRATMGFRLFHAGCRVNGAISDGDLRARVINKMAKLLPGATIHKVSKAVPA